MDKVIHYIGILWIGWGVHLFNNMLYWKAQGCRVSWIDYFKAERFRLLPVNRKVEITWWRASLYTSNTGREKSDLNIVRSMFCRIYFQWLNTILLLGISQRKTIRYIASGVHHESVGSPHCGLCALCLPCWHFHSIKFFSGTGLASIEKKTRSILSVSDWWI